MKTILQKITLLIFTLVSACTVTLAQIPNNDFELWNNFGLGGETPDQWFTSNGDLVPQNVFKDSLTKYSGNYSVLLTNVIGIPGTIGINFPITTHPFQLKGYFKSDFITADSASIKITLFNNTQAVDSGEYFITTSLANWTNITVPISNTSVTVNSVTINITACNQQQNKCWVDLLSFEEPSGVPTVTDDFISLFPNPALSQLTVVSLQSEVEAITISDVLGKIIYQQAVNQKSSVINLQSFSPGIYFLEMESEGKFYRKSFVKE
ncbi:MAG: T9SS type A sorting domain-containing protein [Bacteroidota bacterium]